VSETVPVPWLLRDDKDPVHAREVPAEYANERPIPVELPRFAKGPVTVSASPEKVIELAAAIIRVWTVNPPDMVIARAGPELASNTTSVPPFGKEPFEAPPLVFDHDPAPDEANQVESAGRAYIVDMPAP
jgi:hypothetical protein